MYSYIKERTEKTRVYDMFMLLYKKYKHNVTYYYIPRGNVRVCL